MEDLSKTSVPQIMKVELTKEMIYAIEVAFGELENSGDWTSYLSDDENDKVDVGMSELYKLIR